MSQLHQMQSCMEDLIALPPPFSTKVTSTPKSVFTHVPEHNHSFHFQEDFVPTPAQALTAPTHSPAPPLSTPTPSPAQPLTTPTNVTIPTQPPDRQHQQRRFNDVEAKRCKNLIPSCQQLFEGKFASNLVKALFTAEERLTSNVRGV